MLYINNPTHYLTLEFSLQSIDLSINVMPFISFLLFSLVTTFTTSNIMLANNTCDLEKDEAVKRLTLVHYIGRPAAVKLFVGLYIGCYVALVIMVLCNILNPVALIFLISRSLRRYMPKTRHPCL